MAVANPEDAPLQAKALDRAIAGVESASRIIEAVLGFSRADEEFTQANVSRVIDATLACLGRAPERDGIRLTVEVDPETVVSIRPLALQQVMLNLMLNALAALQGNRGELRIVVAPQGDGTTRIQVADNGPGIPQVVADTLFEPFVTSRPKRGGGGRKGETRGSGLGLAICKRLIEDVGGSITAGPGCFESETPAGPGATFTIILANFAQDGNQKAA
jgi:signal transduction histidine kinase